MTDFGYTNQKLTEVIEGLTTGKGDVRDRLKNIFPSICVLTERDFPSDLKPVFSKLLKLFTKYEPIYSEYNKDKRIMLAGSVEVTMQKIKNKTGQKMAQDIFLLWRRINESL